MKFSAQEEYGLRCLLAVAAVGESGSLTIPEISKAEGLSPSHAAKLLSVLRKAGFVDSTRGQAGGYSLSRDPGKIVLKDVLEALGGRLYADKFCDRYSLPSGDCVHDLECQVRPLWASIQAAVDDVVSRITLLDLIERRVPEPAQTISLSASRGGRDSIAG
jgi:Rrf2 family protein